MCFYYSITRKTSKALVKAKVIREDQVSLLEEKYIVSGFDHPCMPVIADENPGEIRYYQWGMLPAQIENQQQATDFLQKYNTLNAKSEDISTSKLYAESFMHRRCLVLCSGFFEWRQVQKERIPYYITLQNDELFVLAGIWNHTVDNRRHTFAILTVRANELMASIHNTKKRMPLILPPGMAQQWLKPGPQPGSMTEPVPSSVLKAYTIRKFSPGNVQNLNTADTIAYYHYPHIRELSMPMDNTLF